MPVRLVGLLRMQSKGEFKYWGFLSYSRKDDQVASTIFRKLENFSIPAQIRRALGGKAKQLRPLFRDREELSSTGDLGATLRLRLEESKYLIVICSPHAAQSKWVNQEIIDFKRLGRGRQILAAIVGGEPHSADPSRECFPAALRFQIDTDGEVTSTPEAYEPIAANFSKAADGAANALIKLAAGILDVGFDELKRRHVADQQRRAAVMAVGAIAAVIMGLIGLRAAISPMISAEVAIASKATKERVQREEGGKRITIQLEDLASRGWQEAETELGMSLGIARGWRIVEDGLRSLEFTDAQTPLRLKEFVRFSGVQANLGWTDGQDVAVAFASDALQPDSAEANRRWGRSLGFLGGEAGPVSSPTGKGKISCTIESTGVAVITIAAQKNARTHRLPVECGTLSWSSSGRYAGMTSAQNATGRYADVNAVDNTSARSALVFSGISGELIGSFPICIIRRGENTCASQPITLAFDEPRARLSIIVTNSARATLRKTQFDLAAVERMSFTELRAAQKRQGGFGETSWSPEAR